LSDFELSVETLEYTGGGSNKFYRATLVKENTSYWSITQWGSQRSGRTGGQSATKVGGNLFYDKTKEKRAEGYSAVTAESGNWTIPTGSVDHTNLTNALKNKDAKTAAAVVERAMGGRSGTARPVPPPQTQTTCDQCAQVFTDVNSLQTHMRRAHTPINSGGGGMPDDTLTVLAERALSALSLAANDPTKALVERAAIVSVLEGEQKKIARVQSYLDSLDLMLDDELV
jgi:hypothetical protein